ncbi:Gfo/Idh/MocA family protein [Bradyrhizobium sp. CIR3A]|uniref:Gfo/Idh/MocA family protein n=1 Tax=Bradyrhizobium sp. CIR3A TaxID=2663838 RepID=UPI001605EEED|nr:Gfo/Idh/MocA family oxidoreductase [Bradyrhizobium sp. CIR3A]MBB4264149.1 myo-inositol 2-dehydrogenase/D-chiro-inositol 1-dehydrogenase [Bradyrhizobium sp. CIR3A]
MKLGIVGLGQWGQKLVRAIQEDGNPKSQLTHFVAGYTRSPNKHRPFALQEKLHLFESYEEFLRSRSVDAVVIASPHSEHVDQICAAAEAGLHIFVEKPLALDVAGALKAIVAARAAGRQLAVGFNRRFLPAYSQLKEILHSGRIGRVLHLEGNFSAPQALHFAPEDWRARHSETPAGGMTLMGIHVLDAMIGLAGPITGVRARSRKQFLQVDVDDTTDVQIEFAGGFTGYLSTVTATARNWRLQVFGTEGWAEMQGYQQLTLARVGQDPETTRFGAVDIERAELEAFAKSVVDQTEYPIHLDEVVKGIGALEAVFKSVREDRFIAVES